MSATDSLLRRSKRPFLGNILRSLPVNKNNSSDEDSDALNSYPDP
jgi:hypothetical protein